MVHCSIVPVVRRLEWNNSTGGAASNEGPGFRFTDISLAVYRHIHDFAPVLPPMRLHPAVSRDLPPLVPLGEARDVRLPSPGLARTVRHPLAIGRNGRLVQLVIGLIDEFRLACFSR